MSLHLFLDLYAALLGLIVGSYLNVVIYRVPLGLSTVTPRSRCPGCGAAIRARDNVPVLSYLLLLGRCRACGTRISWRYPAIEAVVSLLFVGCLERFGFSLRTPAAMLFCCLMVALAMIDVDHMILPDRITWPGIAVGIAVQPWAPLAGLVPAILGALVGAGILLAVWAAWYLIRREEGMGLGDVKMLAMVGAFLGWHGVLVTLFCGALAGSVVGLALMRWGSHDMRSKLPFGTFLALGGLFALFFGEPLVAAYVTLL
ncbi:MAG TPA: prepilin peptidase [Thermoanaerobaculia bacterium]|nr:prepilin peptidase [Thermoanaerobaculia bacterium]